MKPATSSVQPLLFVGGYAPATQQGLHAFRFDDATGALTARGSFTGIVNPSFLVAHPHRPWLYAVSETSQPNDGAPGAVWALRFEREPLTIQSVNHQPSGGDGPCHLQLDATGQWLFVSNYGTGSVRVLPIREDGSLGEMSDHAQHHGRGPNAQRQEGPHAHSATLSPDNRFAIIADLGLDQLVIYQFDAARGQLSPHGQMHTRPGAGPRHLAFHPNGRIVYVANELDNTVSMCAYDAANGALREVKTLETLPPNAPENIVADIHLSPSGQRLYVSNRGHNSVAVYAVNADGRLTRLAIPPCGGKGPRNFALAPSGRFLLAANQYSDEVSVLPVLAGAAELGAPCARAAVTRPACVQFVAGL
jgi:6-phosphogluconolactonase